MSDEENNGFQQYRPQTDLDYQYITTEPAWGKEVTAELNEKLSKISGKKINLQTGETIKKEHLWGLMSYYTRDIRLGNLTVWNGEYDYCRAYLDLAGDLLREDYIKAFLTALARVISILELSQSKGGFFRKRSNTITSESYQNPLEPDKKRGLFGAKGNKDERRGYA